MKKGRGWKEKRSEDQTREEEGETERPTERVLLLLLFPPFSRMIAFSFLRRSEEGRKERGRKN